MNTKPQGESDADQKPISADVTGTNLDELRHGSTTDTPLRKGFFLAWRLSDNELDLLDTKP